jgi:transcriptional regulator with XRE-family HTH domain
MALANRFQRALDAKIARTGGSQADLARYCGKRAPSVSGWFTGETKSLKADSLVLAAEYLGVRAHWLLTGKGPMEGNDDQAARSTSERSADPSHHIASIVAQLTPERWASVRAQLDCLVAHPERRPAIVKELEVLLPPSHGKPQRAA